MSGGKQVLQQRNRSVGNLQRCVQMKLKTIFSAVCVCLLLLLFSKSVISAQPYNKTASRSSAYLGKHSATVYTVAPFPGDAQVHRANILVPLRVVTYCNRKPDLTAKSISSSLLCCHAHKSQVFARSKLKPKVFGSKSHEKNEKKKNKKKEKKKSICAAVFSSGQHYHSP
ncbi:unnamed protein product [Ceratitis capitata]|uniref:(Mediterranean fruit fly) hypothetical protein n=1 Tax=Ceratitis capitata TaxID=7213 RepID=A0A811TYT7_CERCA|nr:unnamed protein product [Ceratitis capitata]